MTPEHRKILDIATRTVLEAFPKSDVETLEHVFKDDGDKWVVEWLLPEDWIGGTPGVIIDKSSMKVIQLFHTQ